MRAALPSGLPCPICGLAVVADQGRFLPFCSDRCRLIDLGRWLDEEHSIPCTANEEDEQELSAGRVDAADSRERPPVKLPPGWHDA